MSKTISRLYTFVKDGVFYFSRRIPADLRSNYSSNRISYSLRTKSATIAEARARRASDQLDEYWYHLRCRQSSVPGKHMLKHLPEAVVVSGGSIPKESVFVCLTEASTVYLSLKGHGRAETFHRAAQRACEYVLAACGDKPLDQYTKADANAFRDALISRGLAGTSITRVFGTVRSIINFAASEQGLSLNNPFAGVYYDRTAGISERLPVPSEALTAVRQLCRETDDELRWLVALVSDTGMRLAEGAGLAISDFKTDDLGDIHVKIQTHAWRRLKTRSSERVVPLEGAAKWAAERILSQQADSQFAFPRYNRTGSTNSNSASAALNKWLKQYVPDGCSMHNRARQPRRNS
jgi:integrase